MPKLVCYINNRVKVSHIEIIREMHIRALKVLVERSQSNGCAELSLIIIVYDQTLASAGYVFLYVEFLVIKPLTLSWFQSFLAS
jgi:hypothetical protein